MANNLILVISFGFKLNSDHQLQIQYKAMEEAQQFTSLQTAQFVWSTNSSILFKNVLNYSNIQYLVEKFLISNLEKSEVAVDQATSDVNTFLSAAGKQSLKRATIRRRCRISNAVNKK